VSELGRRARCCGGEEGEETDELSQRAHCLDLFGAVFGALALFHILRVQSTPACGERLAKVWRHSAGTFRGTFPSSCASAFAGLALE